jgi:hypothetical protein
MHPRLIQGGRFRPTKRVESRDTRDAAAMMAERQRDEAARARQHLHLARIISAVGKAEATRK